MSKIAASISHNAEQSDKEGETSPSPSAAGEDSNEVTVSKALCPHAMNALAITNFANMSIGQVELSDAMAVLTETSRRVGINNLSQLEEMLTSQAVALNALFGDLTNRSRSYLNAGGHLDAGEKYLRPAFKAQNQFPTTIEALAALKNPPAVSANQVNVAQWTSQLPYYDRPAVREI